jgi:hypothetical protein
MITPKHILKHGCARDKKNDCRPYSSEAQKPMCRIG